jgi:exopolyphosphatase/guanosine-5'-triphosphate,3'-diphosphate pyrophosphatase
LNQYWGVDADPTAQGRIKGARPVAVLDIGSNSVRLVVYERHARSLTPLYNEKSACSLGRGMAANGRLADDNMARAMTAIQRFALVARLMRVGKVHILATSAVRDAANRDEFVAAVEAIMEAPVNVLSGAEEAHYAALGVVAGAPDFAGLVGDLGGGSLELSTIKNGQDINGDTFELGVIRLQDDSKQSPSKAAAIARERLAHVQFDEAVNGGVFCAIGGTWRTLAKIHLELGKYPMHMVQGYSVPADTLAKLCEEIVEAASNGKSYPGSDIASSSRRDLVPYGAAVLSEVLRAAKSKTVMFSALGVREGYLFGLLDRREQAVDPLVQGAEELSVLRSRSPGHADDLFGFTSQYFDLAGVVETDAEKRLRHVACLVADLGWRTHPDYRAEQSIDSVAFGPLTGIDHSGRAFLSHVLAVRYAGLKLKGLKLPIFDLLDEDGTHRAKMIGALYRVAYPMSAAMPGILPRVTFGLDGDELILRLPQDLAFLDGEHLRGRLDQFAGLAKHKSSSVRIA